MFFQVCFSFILCLHFRFAAVDAFSKSNGLDEGRMKRAVGDQPPQGKCLSFKLERQNDVQTIEYVCCNNCGETNQNCLAYRSGSAGYNYCDRCGGNTLNSAYKQSARPFSCGGCAGQTRKQHTCRAQYSTIPATCWLFRGCFERECKKEQGYSVGTCFNGFCDVEENAENCPADCCFKKNPQNCTLVNGKCPVQCCGETSCCKKQDDDSGTSLGLEILKWFGIIVLCIFFSCAMYGTGVYCHCDGNIILPL